jgi:hypothetical protein
MLFCFKALKNHVCYYNKRQCSAVIASKELFIIVRNTCVQIIFKVYNILTQPVPVDARSKASVCGRSLAGIVGSNPASDMGVCLL